MERVALSHWSRRLVASTVILAAVWQVYRRMKG
jgi:hypothetical protein